MRHLWSNQDLMSRLSTLSCRYPQPGGTSITKCFWNSWCCLPTLGSIYTCRAWQTFRKITSLYSLSSFLTIAGAAVVPRKGWPVTTMFQKLTPLMQLFSLVWLIRMSSANPGNADDGDGVFRAVKPVRIQTTSSVFVLVQRTIYSLDNELGI